MRLVPVITIYFQYFPIEKHYKFDLYNNKYIQECDGDWISSLHEAGILDKAPYLELDESWLIEISNLTIEMVKVITSRRSIIYDRNFTEYDNIISGLDGGYSLEFGSALILPRCCCDLSNIEEWDKASDWKDKKETKLWNGHPELRVCSIDSHHLLIREEEFTENPIEIIVNRNELKKSIIEAKQQLDGFRQMIILSTSLSTNNSRKKKSKKLARH